MLDKAEPGWRVLERARINLISFIAFHFKKLHHTDSLWLISVYPKLSINIYISKRASVEDDIKLRDTEPYNLNSCCCIRNLEVILFC